MTAVARLIILSFFLLIATKLLEFFALVHGSPIRPFQVYAVLIAASAIVIILHLRESGFAVSRLHLSASEVALFSILALLILLMLASPGGKQEQGLRSAIWLASNLLMGAALFYFARFMDLGPTIIRAATIALFLHFAGIIVDLWLPGMFAEWAPRPAGPPQNSNNGALLACFLTAILLPITLREQPKQIMLDSFILGLPLIFVTLSKSGLILYLLVLAAYAIAKFASPATKAAGHHRHFLAIFIPLFLVTACMAPTLRTPEAVAIWRARIGKAIPDLVPEFAAVSTVRNKLESFQDKFLPAPNDPHDSNVAQAILDESIRNADDTTQQRLNALKFFWSEALKHPLIGYGTGFVYSFKTGPHNTFLALFVEQGLPAVLLYLLSLCLLSFIAIRRCAVSLFAITLIAWGASLLSHTLLVEPWFIVFACAAVGITKPKLEEARPSTAPSFFICMSGPRGVLPLK